MIIEEDELIVLAIALASACSENTTVLCDKTNGACNCKSDLIVFFSSLRMRLLAIQS